jgi:hypothetical protein
MEHTTLLQLPPGEALADPAFGAEPAKRDVGSSFGLALGSRETMLRRFIPQEGLPRFDLAAELPGVSMLAGDLAGTRVPRQMIRPWCRD